MILFDMSMALEDTDMGEEGELQHLQWDNFYSSMASHFHGFLEQGELVDVTIVAGDGRVRAHRLLLSASSSYLKQLLEASPCEHPVLILEDVGRQELMSLLEFMYRGEVHVQQGQLEAFLQAAETLQVKGLAGCQKGIADDLDAAVAATDTPETPKQDSPETQSDVDDSNLDDEGDEGHGGRRKPRRVARKRKRAEDSPEQPGVASKGARMCASVSGEEDASSGTNGETEFLALSKPKVELVDLGSDVEEVITTGTLGDEASCPNYCNNANREYLVNATDGLQLIQRQRGYPQLVHSNFIFNCQLYEGIYVYWVCQDNYKFNCRASVVTARNRVVNAFGARHNHNSHQQEVEDEMLKGNFRVLPLRRDMFLHVHSSGLD